MTRRVAAWRSDRFYVALTTIVLAALIGRIVYLVWVRDDPVLSDGYDYHYGALFLVDGHGFVNPLASTVAGELIQGAHHPPAWTAVLAAPSVVGLRSFLSHQLAACVVGAATVAMTGLAGRAVLRPRTGLIAALLVAVYPFVWIYERELLSETLAMLGVATTLWLAYRFSASPGPACAVALGAVVGVLAMTRSELLLVSVFLVAPLVLSASGVTWRRRIMWLVAAGVACVVVIAPWAIYNATRFERPVPLSAGLGAVMVTGNCQATYHGNLLGYHHFGCGVRAARNLSSDPSIADGQLRDHALEFMSDHRSRVPIVAAARVGRTFGFFRPFQQMHLETERGTSVWVTRLGFFASWALLPLAVAGAIVARRRKIPIYPLLTFPLIVILAVLPAVGAIRYRAPAEISLVVLAAIALDTAVDARQHRRGSVAEEPRVERLEVAR